MKIAVESWSPEYGSPYDAGQLDEPEVPTDLQVELPIRSMASHLSAHGYTET